MKNPHNKRRVQLILPKFQLRLVGIFAAIATLALLLQYLVFWAVLSQASSRLPNDAVLLMDETNGILLKVLLMSTCILAPIVFWAGILATFRIAGPLYRFHQYLESVIRGEHPADCKLRKSDQLHSLCDLINDATRPIRETADAEGESDDGSSAAA